MPPFYETKNMLKANHLLRTPLEITFFQLPMIFIEFISIGMKN